MVNELYEPTEKQERVLNVLRDEKRVNPLRVKKVTGMHKQNVHDSLDRLVAAGWVRKVNHGLYEYNVDPRGSHDQSGST